jgi:hypothetical protein
MDPEQELLQPDAMRLLTSGFDLDPADVNSDIRRVPAWSGPNDDLLVGIARRYEWSASTSARYLRNLLFALDRKPDDLSRPPPKS